MEDFHLPLFIFSNILAGILTLIYFESALPLTTGLTPEGQSFL